MMGVERAGVADPALMLAFLRDKASARKLQLFACACCRLIWRMLPQHPSRARVEAVEMQLDGRTPLPPRGMADVPMPGRGELPGVYADVASVFTGCGDAFAAALVASSMAERADPLRGGRRAQAAVLGDLFGRPSRLLDRRWLTADVQRMAQSIYDRRNYQQLPRLADLLEAAGCPPHNVLDHFRSAAPHFRGCWALDLVLGKS